MTGSVVDATGAVIPGATVSLKLAGGKAAIFQTVTSANGLFSFTGIRPAAYDLTVDQKGFTSSTIANIKVDAMKESAIPPIKLEVAAAAQAVEVTGDVQAVQTTNAEVASAIQTSQVANLPVLDRQIVQLFYTQAGVSTGRGSSVVNGMHSSMTNITLDGVNVQDNFIRANAVDLVTNNFTVEQVQEVSIATSNANASSGAGSEIALVGKSGTNQMHGSGYWYNRNNATAANTWFNNRDGVKLPGLNLNQIGGSVGGPVKKDKLFYYGNYEAYRYKASTPINHYVLTPDANKGIFTYKNAAGTTFKKNIMTDAGLPINSYVQQTELAIMPTPNNNDIGDGLNYAGYRFNARDNTTRDIVYGKVDYIHSTKHSFASTINWVRDNADRSDAGNFITTVPPVSLNSRNQLLGGSWRWNPTPTLTNELRFGYNRSKVPFDASGTPPKFFYDNAYLLWQTNVNDFLDQGREVNTYNLQDNAQWVRGKHAITFGYQTQWNRLYVYNDAGIVPKYGSDISTSHPYGFDFTDAPGISSGDLGNMNTLLANLGGLVSYYTQSFNVKDRTSGFVNGQTNGRNFLYDNYAGYVQDQWKVKPRLTLTLGLRYEYWTPLDERDGLFLMPVLNGNNYISTMLNPNTTLDFAGGSSGRGFYKKDRNNFAPNVGFAYDVFGDGKTAIRGGYRMAYVSDDVVTALRNSVTTNAGLSATSSAADVGGYLSNPPKVTVPTYKVPRTTLDNYAISGNSNAVGMPDPSLVTPYVQQWNVGIQHNVRGFIVDARYVGNHGTKLLRAIDFNQVIIRQNGLVDDVVRAQGNADRALAAGLGYNPNYNPSVAGSVPLQVLNSTVIPRLGTVLNNSTFRNYIRRGEVGQVGSYLFTNVGLAGSSLRTFTNTAALGNNGMTNYSNSTYNSLQMDVTKRMRSGLSVQFNYTYSKVLSDSLGTEQARFDPFLDNGSPSIERTRAPFDLTHVLKANYYVPLPMGKGKWFDAGKLNRLVEGWGLSGIVGYQSGTPFSILSGRGTVNRGSGSGSRSQWNTVDTKLTKSQLDQYVGFFMTGNGPYFVNPSVLNTDGRGVATEGSPAFANQIFSLPTAGKLGTLQRRMFNGPWNFSWDFSISKDTKITERQSVQFRADFFNVTNHPSFYVGNETSAGTTRYTVDQTSFGKVANLFSDPRVIQFGLYYRF